MHQLRPRLTMAVWPTALVDTYRALSCNKEVSLFVPCQQLRPRLPGLVARQKRLPFSILRNCFDARWIDLNFLLQQQVPTLMLATDTSNVSPVYSLSTLAYTLYTKRKWLIYCMSGFSHNYDYDDRRGPKKQIWWLWW